MEHVIGVVLFPELQKVKPEVNLGDFFFLQTNVLLIRLLAVGPAFFTLDAILSKVIQQLVYDCLSGSEGTIADTAGVKTAARGRELILRRMTDEPSLA